LGDEKRNNQVFGLEADGEAIVESHDDDRVDAVDVEPVCRQKEKDCLEMANLPEGVAQLADTFPYDGRRVFFHSAGALPDEKDQGKGEGGPPESHGKKGELDALAAARQAERGRREGHPHVEGEENPSPEVTHGKAQRRDEIPSRLQGHRRQQRVIEDDGPGKAHHGKDVACCGHLPAAPGDQVKGGGCQDADGGEK
jgi:hypothetical protein